MVHEILPVGMLACNCSVLGDENTGEAVVIDPGDEVEKVMDVLAQHKLHARYIVATHAHLDHVGGVEQLQQATGAAVLMHEADLPLYDNLGMQAEMLGMSAPGIAEVDRFLNEGDTLACGSMTLEVMHTPGHSSGGLSLHLAGDRRRLFSGDTLFQGSIGRTDLWGGSYQEILRSLRTRLLIFPNETPVFPGHGPATTIGEEKLHNPYLQ
jgi:hydroxyacylglutathione hydrolase